MASSRTKQSAATATVEMTPTVNGTHQPLRVTWAKGRPKAKPRLKPPPASDSVAAAPASQVGRGAFHVAAAPAAPEAICMTCEKPTTHAVEIGLGFKVPICADCHRLGVTAAELLSRFL